MPQTFLPFGLSTACYLGGKPRSSSYPFVIQSGTANSFGSGEPVALAGGSLTTLVTASAYPPAYPSEIILGVFLSVEYQGLQPGSAPATYPFWLASTTTFNASNALASINVDPMQVYNVQVNASTSVITSAMVGETFMLGGMGNINTSTGQSRVYMSNIPMPNDTGNYAHVKLLGLAPTTPAYPSNSWGDPYPIVQVVLNSTHFKYGQYSAA